MISKIHRYRMNNVRILPCENRKIDKKKSPFILIDSIAPLKILYKTPGISAKSPQLVIKYSLARKSSSQ